MRSSETAPAAYIASLPDDQRKAVAAVRKVIRAHLPAGFEETMQYGMIAYVVPLSLYPAGYHAKPGTPLPFLSLAGQKGYVGLYHMGLYSMPDLLAWFRAEYPKRSGSRLDMGKSCIRLRKYDSMPLDLIGELAGKIGPEERIRRYEASLGKTAGSPFPDCTPGPPFGTIRARSRT